MAKLNVMHICMTFKGAIGGGETFFLNLAKRLGKEKFNLSFVCPYEGSLSSELRKMRVKTIVVNMESKFNLAVIPRLVYLMKKKNINIVHTHGLRADFFGRIAAKIAKVPIILSTFHILISGYEKNVGRLKTKVYLFLNRLTTALANKVVAVAAKVKEDLILKGGIDPNKIITIYNGIAIDKFKASRDKQSIRKELGLDSQPPIVGIVGRLVSEKGIGYFLQAASRIKKNIPRIKFLIVGNGPSEQELQDLAKNLRIFQDCLFTGFRRDIADIISIFEIGVLPSLCEPFGLIILEYMVLAKPIVATNTGGVPEIIEDGKTGILVAPKNPEQLAQAITSLLNNTKKAQQMGENARKAVESKFNLTKTIKQYEQLYLNLTQAII